MLELLRRDLGDCAAVVIVSDRDDGDVRPDRVPDELLVARQMAMTSSRWVMPDEVHGVDVHRSDGRLPSSAIAAVGGVVGTVASSGLVGARLGRWLVVSPPAHSVWRRILGFGATMISCGIKSPMETAWPSPSVILN